MREQKNETDKEGDPRTESRWFTSGHSISKVTHHYFCCILVVTQTNPGQSGSELYKDVNTRTQDL